MLKPRRGDRELQQIAFARVRIHVDNAFGILERQGAQEEIIDQAKDGSVQADPERERDNRDKSKRRRLLELAESETKIAHRNFIQCATLGPDRPGLPAAPATKTLTTLSPRVTPSLRRAELDCAMKPQRVAMQS